MRRTVVLCLACTSAMVHAQTPEVRAFVELRAVAPADETAWREGGLGKTRFGEGDGTFGVNAAIAASWQATPALLASASAQYVPDQRHDVEVLDAWLRSEERRVGKECS